MNCNSVLDGSDEDTSAEVSNFAAAVITKVPAVSVRSVGHLWWSAVSVSEGDVNGVTVHVLLDTGSHLDLVNPSLAKHLKLCPIALSKPETVLVAIGGKQTEVSFSHVVKFRISDPSFMYMSRTVTACVAPQLSMSILLGMPFLSHNDILLSCKDHTAIYRNSGFDLLNPTKRTDTSRDNTANGPAKRRKSAATQLSSDRKALLKELRTLPLLEALGREPANCVGAVCERIEILAAQDELNKTY